MSTSDDSGTGTAPVPQQANPLARAQRLANWSLICSVLSFFTSGITSFIAFYLAARASRAKEGLGATSVDSRVRTARIIAMIAIVLWAIIWIGIIIVAATSESEPTTSDYRQNAESTAVDLAEGANPGFTAEAQCEEPASTEIGTTFWCTVTFDDGETVPVAFEIVSEGTVRIIEDA